MGNKLGITGDALTEFCLEKHILSLAVFGSKLCGKVSDGYNLELLVEFDSAYMPDPIALTAMELELSGLIGRKVDLRTMGELSPCFRQNVLDSANVQYAQ